MNSTICSIHGVVIKGKEIGRTIGFPTANISLFTKRPDLENGVYGVYVYWKSHKLPGVMNIGVGPTFDKNNHISVEVHLFDFDENIYNEELKVDICFFVRHEMKFSCVEELINQIHKDVVIVKRKFSLPDWNSKLKTNPTAVTVKI